MRFIVVNCTYSIKSFLVQVLLASVLLSFISSSAECEMYKWVDSKGVMNFSDNLSSVPPKYRKKMPDAGEPEEPSPRTSLVSAKYSESKSPMVNEKRDYYYISGRTELELQREMNSRGISGPDGKPHYAFTNWYVRWNYTYRRTTSGCSIASVSTGVDVTYQLPNWVNSKSAPADLRNKWNRFIHNLELHEYGHKEIGVRAAKEIERAIGSLQPRKSCQEVEASAESAGQMVLAKSKPEEVEYDVRTQHGRTQGAVFP